MKTKKDIESVFQYKDGELYWKKTGKKAGSVYKDGYLRVNVNGKRYLNHRLIYFYHHGYTRSMLDHVDGNPLNNQIDNIRKCDHTQNSYNRRTWAVSGVKNVHWRKDKNKWQVVIRADKVTHKLGYFADLELAELVAIEARDKYHKSFARI